MSGPRYAIYYSPAPGSALWRKGAKWLGRDAHSGESLDFPQNLAIDDWGSLSSSPRRYGFHATLKPPMHLVSGVSEDALISALSEWASKRVPFYVRLRCAALGRFIALVPADDASANALSELAGACVLDFEHWRAPLTQDDIDRRRKSALSPAQDALMLRYGYPYVLDEFRFHMTLSNSIEDGEMRERVIETADRWFAQEISESIIIDRIALFREASPGDDFMYCQSFEFARL